MTTNLPLGLCTVTLPEKLRISVRRLDKHPQICLFEIPGEGKELIPISHNAIRGIYKRFDLTDGDYNGTTYKQARFTFDIGENECEIISRISTAFSRSVLQSLLHIGDPKLFIGIIQIVTKCGDNNSVLANVLYNDELIKFQWSAGSSKEGDSDEEKERKSLELASQLIALNPHEATTPPPPPAPTPKQNPLKDYEVPNDIASINASIKESVQRLKILGKYSQEEWSTTIKTQFGVESSTLLSITQKQILAQMLVERLHKVETALESNRAEALKEMGIEP
jgi:hypothetical protein